ncbi:EH domain-containing protein 3-like protein [Tritrichomonas foetus]|uniref:EH domain-containing protein 3-like protein n=1 Tax=Tritrichomonas foetus TaxID=1144522 RepID=A0A1J4JXD6_9EUKA|nr:EH domain-containing protein 3-like protein [Tritrichomonas foetus]|eukprot:OHT01941.1 EH domain-containing protein 3-like protein [Tritrichomonas foetus]
MMNNTSNAVLTQRESVLEEISSIYTQNEYGLLSMSKIPSIQKYLKRQVFLPQKKVIVLIVGSHSTGKSSFANWFFGDTIQKVSAAIETSKFTFITTGRRRQSLDGAATVRSFDFLEGMKDIPHFVDNLQTEKRLPIEDRSTLVTFIDTPGLIGDENRVPYDNEKILLELAKQSQVIFVFSDPLTQAFCDPLINFIKKTHEESRNRMHFFLTKSDTLDEDERSRIIASIVQKLSSAVTNRTIDVRPFHLPRSSLSKMKNDRKTDKQQKLNEEEEDENDDNRKSNSLTLLCEIIDRAVENTVQSNLSQLSQDLSDLTRSAEKASVSLNKRKNLFNITTILFISLLAYLLAACNFRGVYLNATIYPVLLIVFILWIIFYFLRPNKNDLQRIKVFRETTARNANVKLNEFYHEINDPND